MTGSMMDRERGISLSGRRRDIERVRDTDFVTRYVKTR